jgi:hypothetical protein
MKPSRIFLLASVTALVAWGGYRIYRAHMNLVTLNVRNMDVRRVVSKLEWQTWEHIVVSKNVGGKVTLNVHSLPLDEVLNIVGLQTDSRWTRLYPIYSTKKSLGAFNQVLQGNLAPSGNGWLALQQLAAWQQVGLSGFANTLRAENKLVSAQLVDKDVAYTALALSRFSKAQIVPEDGTKGVVNLTLQQVPFEKAVAKVAKQVRHSWSRVYTLQPLNGAALVRKSVPAPATNNDGGEADTNQVAVTQDQGTLAPDRALEAIVSTMTPEERQQTLEQFANGGPGGGGRPSRGGGQPMQGGSYGGGAPGVAGSAGGGGQPAQPPQEDMETRIENRLKNGTVDQRLAHDRSVLNNKKAGK